MERMVAPLEVVQRSANMEVSLQRRMCSLHQYSALVTTSYVCCPKNVRITSRGKYSMSSSRWWHTGMMFFWYWMLLRRSQLWLERGSSSLESVQRLTAITKKEKIEGGKKKEKKKKKKTISYVFVVIFRYKPSSIIVAREKS